MTRPPSPIEIAARAGFTQPQRAAAHLRELGEWLSGDNDSRGTGSVQAVVDGSRLVEDSARIAVEADLAAHFSACADPDAALVMALRLAETDAAALRSAWADETKRERLLALLGASTALGEYLVKHPHLCGQLDGQLPAPRPIAHHFDEDVDPAGPVRPAGSGDSWQETPAPAHQLIAWMRERAQGYDGLERDATRVENGGTINPDGLRAAYWHALMLIAATDLTAEDRLEHFDTTAAHLTDLVDATLALALELAGTPHGETDAIKLAIIAMGKTGGQEINYISDVDVIYVLADEDEDKASVGTQIANRVSAIISGPATEPPLWPIDTALRPEGKGGALIRTLSSCASYYQNWAENWEFHALLKARPAAGDQQVGAAFLALVAPLVWEAASKDGFVDAVQAMRRRVESHLPAKQRAQNLKLGPGGLRDVEFTIQLLQLVHGRTDPSVRVRNTLAAIDALTAGGYIARTDAQVLTRAYRFLRVVEHGAQLISLRRTQMLPGREDGPRRIGRGIDRDAYGRGEQLVEAFDQVRARVRELHRSIFFRPLVAATANLSADQVLMLDPQAVADRLRAAGYRDPAGAVRHVESLVRGASRRATIQRHLLPVLLGWLAEGADPDAGLLAFRRLSDAIGTTHWYLALLRDSAVAARHLCAILPNSAMAERLLMENHDTVQWLDERAGLDNFDAELLRSQVRAIEERYRGQDEAVERVLRLRERQVVRTVLADATLGIDLERSAAAITDATDLTLETATTVALEQSGLGAHLQVAFIAMGRYGGREMGYGSDADLMAVYSAAGMEPSDAAQAAKTVVQRVKELVSARGINPGLAVDFDLRPEGRSGPLARTVGGYVDYWQRWAQTWEKQALLRARPIGEGPLVEELTWALNRERYGGELTASMIKDIRLLKARMERERLPRGVKPSEHLKLGPGGISDVEWVAQLCQMKHSSDPRMQVTSTLAALRGAVEVGALSAADAGTLRRAWEFASRLRAANMLALDRPRHRDVLVHNGQAGRKVASLMGYPPGEYDQVVEHWRKFARQARSIYEDFVQSL